MAKEISFDDKLCPGGRRPRLYVYDAPTGRLEKFRGETVPGLIVALGSKYQRNGKWSGSVWDLAIPDTSVAIYLLSPLHQEWGSSFQSWGAVAGWLAVPIEIAKKVIEAEYPRTAARITKVEEDLALLG